MKKYATFCVKKIAAFLPDKWHLTSSAETTVHLIGISELKQSAHAT